MVNNLNDLLIPIRGMLSSHGLQQVDNSIATKTVRVYFRDIEDHLIDHIRDADGIVGCVAWITSEKVLESLIAKEGGVALVVQKEKYLREEFNQGKAHLAKRLQLYQKLQNTPNILARMIGGLMTNMYKGPGYSHQADINESGSRQDSVEPLRCMGMEGSEFAGRMHNKFLVFCKHSESWPPDFIPYAVWTGSFNFSKTASKSFENAVVIIDDAIARAYMNEFSQISALAEPLNWRSSHISPDQMLD